VPYTALQQHCNLWRNWLDIQSSWDSLAGILAHWAEASQHSEGFTEVAGPGAWNDPDMLIIGNQVAVPLCTVVLSFKRRSCITQQSAVK
jgi:alpha-N-acetylgalactosaminidase